MLNVESDHQSYPTLFFHTFPEGDSVRANFSSHIFGLLRTEADAIQGIQDLFTCVKVFFVIICLSLLFVSGVMKKVLQMGF